MNDWSLRTGKSDSNLDGSKSRGEGSPPILSADLYQALKRLGAEPQEQIAYLSAGGPPYLPDLLYDFVDEVWSVVKLRDEGHLSPEQADAIFSIDRKISEMSGTRPELWTVDALRTRPEWRELRKLAKRALRTIEGAPA